MGGGRKRTRANKRGGGGGVKTRESLAKVLFECSLNALFPKKEKGETKESRRLG